MSGVQVAGIVTGTVGLAGLGVGLGFGIAAKNDADIAHEFCDGNECRTQRGLDAAKDASDAASVSTVAFIAGGVLAALGITFLVAGGEDGEREVAVAPFASGETLGTSVAGQF